MNWWPSICLRNRASDVCEPRLWSNATGWFPGVCVGALVTTATQAQWQRHTIDDRGKGADGVRLLDVNGDGREDVVTGWEESGHVCVYFQPAASELRKPWPRVVVGRRPGVEDAVAVRIGGRPVVISSHEGGEQAVWVHRFDVPDRDVLPSDWLDEKRWVSTSVAACAKASRWMFAIGMRRNEETVGIVLGSKQPHGQVSLLVPRGEPSDDLNRGNSFGCKKPAGSCRCKPSTWMVTATTTS